MKFGLPYTRKRGRNAFLDGAFSPLVDTALTPPTLAPVLVASAELGSFIANLLWTPSNKILSPGFGYRIYVSVDGGPFSAVGTTTDTFFDYDAGSTAGVYEFQVFPYNDSGEGVGSNVASVTLPGESPEVSFYRRPDGVSRYLRPDGVSYYLRP